MFTHGVNEIPRKGTPNVNIGFKTTKLEKQCTRDAVRVHGPRRAQLLRRRIDEMIAADNLAILRTLPGPRCHEMTAELIGFLSVDLDHPYRLIFFPTHNPVPRNDNNSLIWELITDVCIEGIKDTHV